MQILSFSVWKSNSVSLNRSKVITGIYIEICIEICTEICTEICIRRRSRLPLVNPVSLQITFESHVFWCTSPHYLHQRPRTSINQSRSRIVLNGQVEIHWSVLNERTGFTKETSIFADYKLVTSLEKSISMRFHYHWVQVGEYDQMNIIDLILFSE